MPSPSFYSATLTLSKEGQDTQEVRLKDAINGQQIYSLVYALALAFQALQEMGKDPVTWFKEKLEEGTAMRVEADGKVYAVDFATGDFEVITKPRGSKGGRQSQKVVIEL